MTGYPTQEQRLAIKFSIEIAGKRLKELDGKPRLSKSEEYERIMTIETIRRGNTLLAYDPEGQK
jgi:hypothetical protein